MCCPANYHFQGLWFPHNVERCVGHGALLSRRQPGSDPPSHVMRASHTGNKPQSAMPGLGFSVDAGQAATRLEFIVGVKCLRSGVAVQAGGRRAHVDDGAVLDAG